MVRLIPVLIIDDQGWFFRTKINTILISNMSLFDEKQEEEYIRLLLRLKSHCKCVYIDNGAYSLYTWVKQGKQEQDSLIPSSPMLRLKAQLAISRVLAANSDDNRNVETVIIAPDIVNDLIRTERGFKKTLALFEEKTRIKYTLPPNITEVMFVIQGTDLQTRYESFQKATYYAGRIEAIGYKGVVGVPTSPFLKPGVMLRKVSEWNQDRNGFDLHLLGGNRLPLVKQAKEAGYRSTDTSKPYHEIMNKVKHEYRQIRGRKPSRRTVMGLVEANATSIAQQYDYWFKTIAGW